ncbi:hypothetical protein [Labrys wisconsinensis]|uniref:Exo-alpha-sialidase n=1 Tax=Labrys wisconsinensis TaxID=425677 RepID=A0ABU0J5Z3_9HYPH|nr:hypothetical protein [Labrys wisconsinensis]MDQ0469673.1 hypothetical protein [Labrys wisconsinensis]
MFRRQGLLIRILPVSVLALGLSAAVVPRAASAAPPCAAYIRIRVGLPHVVRGPAADTVDNRLTEIRLPDGRFRGFVAHGTTRAIDGRDPMDMGGPARPVLGPGARGGYAACGRWLDHAEPAGAEILGFVHDETACDYPAGQTHKSMSIATSGDHGLTWRDLGQIITGSDAPAAGRDTGEGDCAVVDGRDGFFYAYCVRSGDGSLIVARAPVSSPGPGQWRKYADGRWDQPGLGGDAARLANGSGASVARWTTTGDFVLTGWVRGGLGLFLSADRTTLVPVPEPLLAVDSGVWRRPAPSELIAYPVLLDARTGANQLSDAWLLAYAYWPPGGRHDEEYLVLRSVDVSALPSPLAPQVGVLLARWHDAALHDRWSTTGPVPGDGSAYRLEARSGYLMTAPDARRPSVELEDCVSERPGHPDHLLAEKGFCAAHAYRRLRTAGWVYAQAEPETVPLYRCYDAGDQSHFASNLPDCEGLGTDERLLGYALRQ